MHRCVHSRPEGFVHGLFVHGHAVRAGPTCSRTRIESSTPVTVSTPTSDSIVDSRLLPLEAAPAVSDSNEAQVLALFDRSAPQLLRYVSSFGLGAGEAEDVVQDTF